MNPLHPPRGTNPGRDGELSPVESLPTGLRGCAPTCRLMSAVTESLRDAVPDRLPDHPARALIREIARHKWLVRFGLLVVALFGLAGAAELALPSTAGSLLAAMFGSLALLGLAVGVIYGLYAAYRRIRRVGERLAPSIR